MNKTELHLAKSLVSDLAFGDSPFFSQVQVDIDTAAFDARVREIGISFVLSIDKLLDVPDPEDRKVILFKLMQNNNQ